MLSIVVLSTVVTIINPFIVSSPTGLRHMNNNYRKLLLKNLLYKATINIGRQLNKTSEEHKMGQSCFFFDCITCVLYLLALKNTNLELYERIANIFCLLSA